MKIELKGHQVQLLPLKALMFSELKSLVIADLHLGKASHFRKSGIAVPNQVFDSNIENLIKLLQWEKPKEVIFLGDLFHSTHNNEWNHFSAVIRQFPQIVFKLIIGNHDILDREHYAHSNIQIIEEYLDFDKVRLSHEPIENCTKYNIYGHLHPGVRMVGKGRQSLRLPCFYFTNQFGVLPAFGTFTGLALQKPKEGERVYVVANNKILCVSQSFS
ncbi:MAG: ligase-associated DNA damage response endonuclease PdeM [Bacteroidia bacterium]